MTTIPKLGRMLNEVLAAGADALASVSGFVRRQSKLSGSVFVQTLVSGWLGTPVATIDSRHRTSDTWQLLLARRLLRSHTPHQEQRCA